MSHRIRTGTVILGLLYGLLYFGVSTLSQSNAGETPSPEPTAEWKNLFPDLPAGPAETEIPEVFRAGAMREQFIAGFRKGLTGRYDTMNIRKDREPCTGKDPEACLAGYEKASEVLLDSIKGDRDEEVQNSCHILFRNRTNGAADELKCKCREDSITAMREASQICVELFKDRVRSMMEQIHKKGLIRGLWAIAHPSSSERVGVQSEEKYCSANSPGACGGPGKCPLQTIEKQLKDHEVKVHFLGCYTAAFRDTYGSCSITGKLPPKFSCIDRSLVKELEARIEGATESGGNPESGAAH